MARGLFRLWLVGTVLWGAFWLLMLLYDSRKDALLYYLPLMVTPPATVLAIGAMIYWALKGFRSDGNR